MTLKEKIEVMEAFERGEEIEYIGSSRDKWEPVKSPSWNWALYSYRSKPKPKQTMTIEKWLCLDGGLYFTLEGSFAFIHNYNSYITKVKLLDTYEVEL